MTQEAFGAITCNIVLILSDSYIINVLSHLNLQQEKKEGKTHTLF